MGSQRRDGDPEEERKADKKPTEEQEAFARTLREEFTSRFGVRSFASRVEADASTVSRYVSGKRMAPAWFIDRMDREARQRGTPIAPAKLDDLRRLRAAALRSSGNPIHNVQATVEALEKELRDVTVRWTLEREHGEVQKHLRAALLADRRTLVAQLQQLQHDLAAARESLAQTEAERERGRRVEHENADYLRQLQAASEYVQDVQNQLESSERQGAQLADTIRLLEQELAVLRRQVRHLQQEQEGAAPRTEQGEPPVAGAASLPRRAPHTSTASRQAADDSAPAGALPRAPQDSKPSANPGNTASLAAHSSSGVSRGKAALLAIAGLAIGVSLVAAGFKYFVIPDHDPRIVQLTWQGDVMVIAGVISCVFGVVLGIVATGLADDIEGSDDQPIMYM